MRAIATLADDIGFDVFATTEHHFHSEGVEASIAPLLLYTDLAARTKRIKFAPLALVLPGWDPIRAAEELAVLDHLTQGRLYAGFARGYQDRWVNVLGQHYHTTGAGDVVGDSIDQHNREVFEEMVQVIRKAWTEDAVSFDGRYYKIPFPYEEGITRWPVAEWTRKYGAPGEIDDDGIIRKISVVPKPFQQPHPPLMQPFSFSERTIRYTAENGIMPFIMLSVPSAFTERCRLYREVAGQAGRSLALGEGVGAFRAVHLGRTEDEAVELLRATHHQTWFHYLGPFGFWESHGRTPEDVGKYQADERLPPEAWTVERLRRVKYALAGTPAQVRADVEALRSIHGAGGELEWLGWFFDQGMMPLDEAKRQLEIFGEEIIPHFR